MKPKAFVLMPFDAEFDDVYQSFIAEILSDVGYEVQRADDLVSHQNILKDVLEGITSADLVVADLSGSNPNVYYELGLAHAFERPTVLLTRDLEELPFDLRPYRVIPYDTHFTQMNAAKVEFKKLAGEAFAGRIQFGSPVIDFPVGSLPSRRQPTKPVGQQDEVITDELGFLDHLVQVEEGFEGMAKLTNDIGGRTSAIGNATRSTTQDLKQAQSNPSSGIASYQRKVVRKLGKQLGEYGAKLAEANEEYRSILNRTGDSLEAVVQAPLDPGAATSLKEFLDALGQLENASMNGRDSLQIYLGTMQALSKIERTFNRARDLTVQELKRFVENIDLTIAMISRARGSGKRILDDISDGLAPTDDEGPS